MSMSLTKYQRKAAPLAYRLQDSDLPTSDNLALPDGVTLREGYSIRFLCEVTLDGKIHEAKVGDWIGLEGDVLFLMSNEEFQAQYEATS